MEKGLLPWINYANVSVILRICMHALDATILNPKLNKAYYRSTAFDFSRLKTKDKKEDNDKN